MNYQPYTYTPQPKHNGLRIRNDSKGHVWCGPAALSAALGVTTTEASTIIKCASMRKGIKGVTYAEMEHALASRRIRFVSTRYPREAVNCMTLGKWLKSRKLNCTYLICITGHWVAIRGNHWACNMNTDGRLVEEIPYTKAKVRYVICLQEEAQ